LPIRVSLPPPALDDVVCGSAEQLVVAGVARDDVRSGLTRREVVARAGADGVWPTLPTRGRRRKPAASSERAATPGAFVLRHDDAGQRVVDSPAYLTAPIPTVRAICARSAAGSGQRGGCCGINGGRPSRRGNADEGVHHVRSVDNLRAARARR
jgi:hypothetical protein